MVIPILWIGMLGFCALGFARKKSAGKECLCYQNIAR